MFLLNAYRFSCKGWCVCNIFLGVFLHPLLQICVQHIIFRFVSCCSAGHGCWRRGALEVVPGVLTKPCWTYLSHLPTRHMLLMLRGFWREPVFSQTLPLCGRAAILPPLSLQARFPHHRRRWSMWLLARAWRWNGSRFPASAATSLTSPASWRESGTQIYDRSAVDALLSR